MRRRDFLGALGGMAASWPLAARGQQLDRVRRIGMLLPATADDKEFQIRVGAFLQGLQEAGWSLGRNIRVDIRWANADPFEIRKHATELVALTPDIIVAYGAATVGPLLQMTRTIPIVFPVVADPVGSGFVDNLARPGGNVTGFMSFEYSLSGNGWSCSSRSIRALGGWECFGIPPALLGSDNSVRRRRPDRG